MVSVFVNTPVNPSPKTNSGLCNPLGLQRITAANCARAALQKCYNQRDVERCKCRSFVVAYGCNGVCLRRFVFFFYVYLSRAFFPARCASAYTYLPDLHIRINDRFRLGPSLFYNRVREDRLPPPKLMLYSRENRERLLFPVGL